MTDQQIIDNNILIAEFDGWKELKTIKGVYVKNGMTLSSSLYTKPLFCYHTDWNLLMPVVAKIQDYQCSTFRALAERQTVLTFVGSANIKAVHKAVVEFIKWYNKEGK